MMKPSTRFMAILLTAVMLFALAACGAPEVKKDSADTSAKQENTGAAAEQTEQAQAGESKTDSTKAEENAPAEDKKSEESSKELKKLTFVLDWSPNTNHTGVYAASKLGYYAEEGLELDIQQPPEDGAEALVAAGHAQFGVSFQDMIAPAWAKDEPLPVTAIAAIINHNTSGLISLKEKGIDSFKKLEGHNYASWQNPIELAIMKNVVEKAGGDWSKVEVIPSTVTDVITALKTDVDSVWVYYAWDGIAFEVAKIETNYLPFIDANPVFDFYSPVIIANNRFMKENPELVKAFMRATTKGYQYAMEHPDEAADILLEAAPELNKDMVHASQKWLVDQYQADSPVWGRFDAERWNKFYAWLWENKVIEKEIPEGFGFTNDFIVQ